MIEAAGSQPLLGLRQQLTHAGERIRAAAYAFDQGIRQAASAFGIGDVQGLSIGKQHAEMIDAGARRAETEQLHVFSFPADSAGGFTDGNNRSNLGS